MISLEFSSDGLNHCISLETPVGNDLVLSDILQDKSELTPAQEVNRKEAQEILEGDRTPLLRNINILRLSGHTYKEISQMLQIHISKVRRIIEKEKASSLEDLKFKLK